MSAETSTVTRQDCIPDNFYTELREELASRSDPPWAIEALIATVFVAFSAHEANPGFTEDVLGKHATELAWHLGHIAAIDHSAKTEHLWSTVRTLLDAAERGELLLPNVKLKPTALEGHNGRAE